jgi:hypothetical protein
LREIYTGAKNMNERVPTLGGYLVDTLKELAEKETLVDIILSTPPMSSKDEKIVERETRGVRVIVVGEDHVVLGPMRPVVSCFIPFDEILMIRIAQTESIESPESEFSSVSSEEESWYLDEDEGDAYLLPDGQVHFVEAADFGEAIADTPVVIVILDDKKDSPKIDKIMNTLAEEFEDEALFVKVVPSSSVKRELGIEKLPAVVILSDDEIFSQIEGVRSTKNYRRDIQDALDEMEGAD